MDNINDVSALFKYEVSDIIITDSKGYCWKKITSNDGYQRICDKFFWPFNPLNNDNFIGEFPPSIEEVEIVRNKNNYFSK